MSVKLIALELYRLQQEVESLEKKLADAAPKDIAKVEDELREARAEHQKLRKMLDGKKAAAKPDSKAPRFRYGF